MLTGKQIRAARVLADWDADDLAQRVGMSRVAIQNIERGDARPKPATLEKITRAFSDAGIEFTENEGLRRRPEGVEIFDGPERYENFIDFMCTYLDLHGGEVCISVTDERYLQRARKNIEAHRKRMLDLVNTGRVTGRILAAEGDFVRTWAELRRQTMSDKMPQVSFFTFGDNLALVSFEHKIPPYVILHKSSPFALAYKSAFEAAWEKARPPHE